jgi:hypothetical protein
MSGPLASWVSVHSKVPPPARALLVQIALECLHDGTPDYDLTKADFQHRTGLPRATVTRALAVIRRSGEVQLLKAGVGRGVASRYQIVVWSCPPDGGCHSCRILAKVQKRAQGEPFSGSEDEPKRAHRGEKRAQGEPKRAQGEPHLGTDLGSPAGNKGDPEVRGEWSHAAAAAPDGAAAARSPEGRQEPTATPAQNGQGLAALAAINAGDWDHPAVRAALTQAWEILTGKRPGAQLADDVDAAWDAATAEAVEWFDSLGAKASGAIDDDYWTLPLVIAEQVDDKWLSDDGRRVEGFDDVMVWQEYRDRWPARPRQEGREREGA